MHIYQRSTRRDINFNVNIIFYFKEEIMKFLRKPRQRERGVVALGGSACTVLTGGGQGCYHDNCPQYVTGPFPHGIKNKDEK